MKTVKNRAFNDGMRHMSIGDCGGVPELQQPYVEMIRFFKRYLGY